MGADGATRKRSTWVRKLAIAIVSLVATLGIAELVLRAWFPVAWRRPVDITEGAGVTWTKVIHRASSVPGLTYELRPGAVGDAKDAHVEINSLGMRGREIDRAKRRGVLRVAVLGDSVAFGFGVAQEAIFPRRLEDMLASVPDRKHDYEVLDLAVTGYSSQEEAAVLEHVALPLDPDLVVVAYYLNDPDFSPVFALRMAFHRPEWWERSELLRLAGSKREDWRRKRYGGGDYYRMLHHEGTDEWKSVERAFARMHELADARAIRVVLAIFPTFAKDGKPRATWPAWSDYAYGDLHAQVRRAAEAERFTVLDVLDVYRASGKTPSELARDFDHPNALGHELAARAIEELLLARHEELFGAPR